MVAYPKALGSGQKLGTASQRQKSCSLERETDGGKMGLRLAPQPLHISAERPGYCDAVFIGANIQIVSGFL